MENKNKLKSIILIDPFWEGHHNVYLKLYSKVLLELGYRICVFCPNPKQLLEELGKDILPNSKRISTHRLVAPVAKVNLPYVGRFFSSLQFWIETRKKIDSILKINNKKSNLYFFLWLDSYMFFGVNKFFVDLIFPYKWAGLYFHPWHLRLNDQPLLSFAAKMVSPCSALESDNCKYVAILDEGVRKKMKRYLGYKKPVIVFPDVTDESRPDANDKLASVILKKAKGRPIIGSLGSIEKRKGTFQLIEIAKKYPEDKAFFVFQGHFYKYTFTKKEYKIVEKFVNAKGDNYMIINKNILDEGKFNALIHVCDLLYLAYIDFRHSANLLTKAALLRKLVIVSDDYCMAERVKRYKMGVVVDNEDLVEQVNVMKLLLQEKNKKNEKINSGFADYFKNNSYKKLKQIIRRMQLYNTYS